MVWYFINVYIINRILHGRLEILNFSFRVEKKNSLVRCAHSWNIFQHSKRNFVSPRGHVISSIYGLSPMLAFALATKGYFSLCTARFSPLLEKRHSEISVLSGMVDEDPQLKMCWQWVLIWFNLIRIIYFVLWLLEAKDFASFSCKSRQDMSKG